MVSSLLEERREGGVIAVGEGGGGFESVVGSVGSALRLSVLGGWV